MANFLKFYSPKAPKEENKKKKKQKRQEIALEEDVLEDLVLSSDEDEPLTNSGALPSDEDENEDIVDSEEPLKKWKAKYSSKKDVRQNPKTASKRNVESAPRRLKKRKRTN